MHFQTHFQKLVNFCGRWNSFEQKLTPVSKDKAFIWELRGYSTYSHYTREMRRCNWLEWKKRRDLCLEDFGNSLRELTPLFSIDNCSQLFGKCHEMIRLAVANWRRIENGRILDTLGDIPPETDIDSNSSSHKDSIDLSACGCSTNIKNTIVCAIDVSFPSPNISRWKDTKQAKE